VPQIVADAEGVLPVLVSTALFTDREDDDDALRAAASRAAHLLLTLTRTSDAAATRVLLMDGVLPALAFIATDPDLEARYHDKPEAELLRHMSRADAQRVAGAVAQKLDGPQEGVRERARKVLEELGLDNDEAV